MRTTRADAARGAGVTSVGFAALAIALPKCPLCVAVWLTGCGVAGSTALDVAPFARPLAAIVAALGIVVAMRARRRRACCRG